MPDRIAFRMTLHPGQAEEYERRHDAIPADLVALLKGSGVSDYEIWLDPESHHLFGVLTRADDHGLDALPDHEVMRRWWAMMRDIMDSHPDNAPVQVPLRRVFHLP